jgi:hypothetical protein
MSPDTDMQEQSVDQIVHGGFAFPCHVCCDYMDLSECKPADSSEQKYISLLFDVCRKGNE